MEAAGEKPTGLESPLATANEAVSNSRTHTTNDHNPTLLAGLAASDDEKSRLATIFWEKVWTKLAENGWSKVTKPSSIDSSPGPTVLATRKNLDFQSCKEGQDYYSSIKDVIDRINERRNAAESRAADIFRRAQSNPGKMPSPSFEPTFRRKRRKADNVGTPLLMKSPAKSPHKLDLSWKNAGGDIFPKKSSRVGDEWQAKKIPKAGILHQEDNLPSDAYCELIWDPKAAAEKGLVLEEGNDVVSGVAHNLREQALLGLASVNYNVKEFESSVAARLLPWDGSDWTEEQREQFHAEIFRTRRDVPAVAKLMDLPVKVCHTYYLGTYKNSNDYRLLKTVGMEERETKEEVQDTCAVCGDGGNLIICDGCEVEYHLNCLSPALAQVPEGYWECDYCVDRRLIKARNDLLRNSSLFELVEHDEQQDSVSTPRGNAMQKPAYRPAAPFLQAVREMSLGISEALYSNPKDGTL